MATGGHEDHTTTGEMLSQKEQEKATYAVRQSCVDTRVIDLKDLTGGTGSQMPSAQQYESQVYRRLLQLNCQISAFFCVSSRRLTQLLFITFYFEENKVLDQGTGSEIIIKKSNTANKQHECIMCIPGMSSTNSRHSL